MSTISFGKRQRARLNAPVLPLSVPSAIRFRLGSSLGRGRQPDAEPPIRGDRAASSREVYSSQCDKPTISHSQPDYRQPRTGHSAPVTAWARGLFWGRSSWFEGLISWILNVIAQLSHSRLCCAIRRKLFLINGGPVATRTPDLYRVKVAL